MSAWRLDCAFAAVEQTTRRATARSAPRLHPEPPRVPPPDLLDLPLVPLPPTPLPNPRTATAIATSAPPLLAWSLRFPTTSCREKRMPRAAWRPGFRQDFYYGFVFVSFVPSQNLHFGTQ